MIAFLLLVIIDSIYAICNWNIVEAVCNPPGEAEHVWIELNNH